MIPNHDDDIYNRCDIYGRFIGEERAIKICLMFMRMEIESRCIGEESDIKKKLCSEQTRRCNEEGCPVEFKWAGWSMWTGCSVTCDKGTKTRIRSCHPAEHGGKPCPEKNKENLQLYEEKRDCSRVDCESYRPTRWSGWSACSATCGLGQMRRSRGCESMRTLKPVD